MSLYNQVSQALSKQGLTGSIGVAIGSATSILGSDISGALGGGKVASGLGNAASSMASNALTSAVNKAIPVGYQKGVNLGAGVVGDLMNGDWDSAGMRLLDSGLLGNLFTGMKGLAEQQAYWNSPTPLFGGISPAHAKRIYQDAMSETRVKKNLFLIEITSALAGGSFNMPDRFNLFVTEIEYAPMTISADKKKVGGATVDSVNSAEPVEMRMTTTDDKEGSIKKWYEAHHNAVAAQDGTMGVPADYAIKIKIVHGFITLGSNKGGYEEKGYFRPQNIDFSHSRREDGLSELQMTFSQLDTFLKVS